MKKKELWPRHHWMVSFMSLDRNEFSKEPEPFNTCHQHQAWMKLQLALHLLLLMMRQLYHFPLPLPPHQYLFLLGHLMPTPVCQILYCTFQGTVLWDLKYFFFSVFKFFKIYFWLCWVFVAAWAFSNCDEQGCFLVEVYRLLAVVVSLVAKHRP